MPKKIGKWKRIAAIAAAALAVAVAALALFADRLAIWALESYAGRQGAFLSIGGLDWTPWGRIEIRDLAVGAEEGSPLAASFAVGRLQYESLSDLRNGRLSELTLDSPRVDLGETQALIAGLAEAANPTSKTPLSLQAALERLPRRVELDNLLVGEPRASLTVKRLTLAVADTPSSGTRVSLAAGAASPDIPRAPESAPIALTAEAYVLGNAVRVEPLRAEVAGRQTLRASIDMPDWRRPATSTLRAEFRDFVTSEVLTRLNPEWARRAGGRVENGVVHWSGSSPSPDVPEQFMLEAAFQLRDAFADSGAGVRLEGINQDMNVNARLDGNGRLHRLGVRATGSIERLILGLQTWPALVSSLSLSVAPLEAQRQALDIEFTETLSNEGLVFPNETQLRLTARGAGLYDLAQQSIEAQFRDCALEVWPADAAPVALGFSGETQWDAARPASFANRLTGRITGLGEGVDVDFRPGPAPTLTARTERLPIDETLRTAVRLGAPARDWATGDLAASATLTLAAPDDLRIAAAGEIAGFGPGPEAPLAWQAANARFQTRARFNPADGRWIADSLSLGVEDCFAIEGAASWSAGADPAARFKGKVSTPGLDALARLFQVAGASIGGAAEFEGEATAPKEGDSLRLQGNWTLRGGVIQDNAAGLFIDQLNVALPATVRLSNGPDGRVRLEAATRPGTADLGFLEALGVIGENFNMQWEGGEFAFAPGSRTLELRNIAVEDPDFATIRIGGGVEFPAGGARPDLHVAFEAADLNRALGHFTLPEGFHLQLEGGASGNLNVQSVANTRTRIEATVKPDAMNVAIPGGALIQGLRSSEPIALTFEAGAGAPPLKFAPRSLEAGRIVAGGLDIANVKARLQGAGTRWDIAEISGELFSGRISGASYLAMAAPSGKFEAGADLAFQQFDVGEMRDFFASAPSAEEAGLGDLKVEGAIDGGVRLVLRGGKLHEAVYHLKAAGGPIYIDRQTILELLVANRPAEDRLIYQKYVQSIVAKEDLIPFDVAEGDGSYMPLDPGDPEETDEFLLSLHLIYHDPKKKTFGDKALDTARRVLPFMGTPIEGDLNLTIDTKLDRLELLRLLKEYQAAAEESVQSSRQAKRRP